MGCSPHLNKEQPLTAASLHALRVEHTRRAGKDEGSGDGSAPYAAETVTLERILSDLVNQACALTPAEIALMWQTAQPRMPIPRPGPVR